MKIFKRTGIFWISIFFISLLLILLGYRTFSGGMAEHIVDIYTGAIRDIVVLGLIIPTAVLLLLWEIDNNMRGSRMIAFRSRENWWRVLSQILIRDCFCIAGILLFPVFVMVNIYIGVIHTLVEIGYVFFLFITWFLYLYFLAVCMAVIEVKVHRSIVAFCSALLISYIPNVVAFLLRQLELPTIGGILNLSYAFYKNEFRWVLCENLCAVLLCLLISLWYTGRKWIQKQDIFWRM